MRLPYVYRKLEEGPVVNKDPVEATRFYHMAAKDRNAGA